MIVSIISFLSSILSAMGVGGGTIYIAAVSFFTKQGQQILQIENLIVFIFAAMVATIKNIKDGIFDKKLFVKLMLFGIVGSIIGSILQLKVEEKDLKHYFYILMFVISIYEIFSSVIIKAKGKNKDTANDK